MDTVSHRSRTADLPAWFSLRHKAAPVAIILIVIAWLGCAFLILGFFPWQTDFFPKTLSWQMVALAKFFGAAVPILLVIQVGLVSRFSRLCRIFSLPGLIHAHRVTALIILSLAGSHILLLGLSGEYSFTSFQMTPSFFSRLGGVIAFLLLAGGTGAGFFREKLSLPYHHWFRLHGPAMGMGIILVYAHIVTIGGMYSFGPARWILLTLPGCLAALVLRLKFFRPRHLARQSWRVISVDRPAPDILKLTLGREHPAPFAYLPGQFVCVRFFSPDIPAEEHPFTLASSPSDQDAITLFIKQCGDYTSILSNLVPGTRATVDGPFGVFSPAFHIPRSVPQRPRVMIAGGIGITPFISMIRKSAEHANPPPTLLVWSVTTTQELFLKNDLEEMQQTMPDLQLYFRITRSTSHEGYTGRLSFQDLQTLLPPWRDATVFICGPVPMITSMHNILKKLGFPKKDLITERFSL